MNIKITLAAILVLLMLAGCSAESEQMTGAAAYEDGAGDIIRIAVAAKGDNEDSKISPGIGKAEYFLIFEGETLVKKIENVYGRGTCGEVAQVFLEEEVDVVACGKFGSNIIGFLKENDIEMFTAKGRLVRDAVKDLT